MRSTLITLFLLTLAIITYICADDQPAYAAKDPKVLFEDGVKFATEDNLKKAEKNFKTVIKLSPDNYPTYFNLSLLYFKKEDFKQSLKYGLKTAELNPFDIRIKKVLSSTHLLLNEYKESRDILSSLSSQNPKDVDTHKKLGVVHLRENNIRAALAEFTLTKNLAPSDLDGNLLLAASFILNNTPEKALQKIKSFRGQLTDNASLAFYAYLLEKNHFEEDAEILYSKTKIHDKDTIIQNLITALEKDIISSEAGKIAYIQNYENTEISKRMADKMKREILPGAIVKSKKSKKARPLGWKATLTEKWEHYNRRPRTSSPINAMNVTSNLKLEGRTKGGIGLSGEWEGFYNRWDNNKLDYYKINANKRNDYEVDIGKFSAKHFPTLVSFPTVLEGFRFWKKTALFKFEQTPVSQINDKDGSPVNLGELYKNSFIDNRLFKEIETTFVVGRTKEKKSIGDRKEESEDTLESSGQFQQWTQSYRIQAKVNSFFDVGSSLSITQDISRKTNVSDSTTPIESIVTGFDAGLKFLDGDFTIDGEIAYGNYDEDTFKMSNKHFRDIAWILESKYKISETLTFDYEQKAVGRNFKVEGASQTQDKTSHTIDLAYKPLEPKDWSLQSQTIQFKPEVVSPDGHGTTKQRFSTVQTITDIKLPQNSKFLFDYKYYREFDKCNCTNYRTFTFKNSFELKFDSIQTKIEPSYTFERKDDMILSPTDEKKKEYIFKIENKSVKNLEIDYSFERERKKFNGATTKSYKQYINTLEFTYDIIPSRFDTSLKLSKDYKNPSDTNKTIITALTLGAGYTSKDGDNKFDFKFERKNNKYLPHSDSSAYHQKYLSLKYTRKF